MYYTGICLEGIGKTTTSVDRVGDPTEMRTVSPYNAKPQAFLFIVIYNIFRRHNNMIYLLNFNITYIITLLHVSTPMSHLQA